MKAIKIGLALAVVGMIAYFIIQSLIGVPEPPVVPLAHNQFTKRIEQETDSLGRLPDSRFCRQFYDEIRYHIDNYHSQRRLGGNQLENDQWRANLHKNLYSAYAGKFIDQAFFVFRGQGWGQEDLVFIRSECRALKYSPMLKGHSPVDNKLSEIQEILRKHDEIASFISSCETYTAFGSSLSDRFPIAESQDIISRAAEYRRSSLGNVLVNNCTRLHNGLKAVPQFLFQAHVSYLDGKIDRWSGLYANYNSQLAYSDNLYGPLEAEIKSLDNDVYELPNFEREYNRLTAKWETDAEKAYAHFNR